MNLSQNTILSLTGEGEQKKDAIEEHAGDMDRDLTEREQDRWDNLDSQYEGIDACASQIQEAMDALEYAQSEIGEWCEE